MKKMLKKVFSGEIKGINNDEQTLTAIISTNAVDRMGEVLDPKGIDLKHFRKNPIVAWAHNYETLPIGKALWVKKSPEGIISKVKFASHEFAQEVFQMYKEGFLKAFSVGFIPKEWEDGDGKKQPHRKFLKWELLEYSAVPIPANPEALQLAMEKGLLKDDNIIDDIQKAMDDEDFEPEEKADEESDKESEEEQPKESSEDSKGLESLLAENKLLAEEVMGLRNENSDLRWQIYELSVKQTQNIAGIADDLSIGKAQSMIDGAISKMTGKVN